MPPRDGVIVDDGLWKKLYNLVQKANGASVRVGIPDGEIAEIGMIHEFGAPNANIPERSFLRSTFRAKRPELIAIQARIAALIMAGKITPKKAMELLGQFMAGAVKATITAEGKFAPLKESTVRAKKSSKPLIDDGDLVKSITYEVDE